MVESNDWGLPPAAYPEWMQVRWEQAHDRGAGDADRLALLRQHLLWHDVNYKGLPSVGRVPHRVYKNHLLERHGLYVQAHQSNTVSTSADAWQPHWLSGALEVPPAIAAHAMASRRRTSHTAPGDPVLHRIKLKRYRTAGQRSAMRAVLTAPPGSTLLVVLPTGSGKSLCAHLPATLDSDGLTLVIVPTVALALDQQQALREWVKQPKDLWGPGPYAYQGGSTATIRLAKETIRERIRSGEQRIVFTSPEAALTSLAPALFDVARAGLLRRMVIDEAHLVDQWGEGFRPSFQDLAGFRRALIEASLGDAFRTLLLSATVTLPVQATLRAFFEGPGPFATMAAPLLRPEPSYWHHHCDHETQRKKLSHAGRIECSPKNFVHRQIDESKPCISKRN